VEMKLACSLAMSLTLQNGPIRVGAKNHPVQLVSAMLWLSLNGTIRRKAGAKLPPHVS
jgi:hypothetical protein